MRRVVVIGMLLITGCQSIKGPFAPRPMDRVDDPRLSIPEQQVRGRDRLALPEDDRTAPRLYVDRPDPVGR